MTCLLNDAYRNILQRYGDIPAAIALTRSILYADDTLIIESEAEIAQTFTDTIRALGNDYGLSFNESKFEVLSMNHDGFLRLSTGEFVKKKIR